MPNPHFDSSVIQRSKGQLAVAGATYQSRSCLFSAYDQKDEDYTQEQGIVYTEILLPANAPPGNNPHCHILLTMRAMEENGKRLPKSRKVYDLDENGKCIRLPSGYRKSHKEYTVDWNEQSHGEEWRQGWAYVQNRCLENLVRPERVDFRSYERQEIDKIPTVHIGSSVAAMERKGIETNIGNLNRDIKSANKRLIIYFSYT